MCVRVWEGGDRFKAEGVKIKMRIMVSKTSQQMSETFD